MQYNHKQTISNVQIIYCNCFINDKNTGKQEKKYFLNKIHENVL